MVYVHVYIRIYNIHVYIRIYNIHVGDRLTKQSFPTRRTSRRVHLYIDMCTSCLFIDVLVDIAATVCQ